MSHDLYLHKRGNRVGLFWVVLGFFWLLLLWVFLMSDHSDITRVMIILENPRDPVWFRALSTS